MIVILAGKTVKGNVTINVADKDDERVQQARALLDPAAHAGFRGSTPVTP